MTLYLLRHAIALDRSEWRGKDSDRPLTPEGIRKMRKAARGLKRLKLSLDAILTSPHRRAYETALIAAEALKSRKKLKIVKALASAGDPRQLVRALASEYGSSADLLLVGHEPYLSRLASVLIGAERPLALDFKKGGLCKLNVKSLRYGRCAALEWLLPPKLLRRLAVILFAVFCLRPPTAAADSLEQWAADFAKPEVQQAILNRIFSGQIGPASSAGADQDSGTYFFPKGGSWARLGKDFVVSLSSAAGASPFFAVSCMIYRAPDRDPMNATSYLFRDTSGRPAALSSGYAAHERIQSVQLPKLGKIFLLLIDSSGSRPSGPLQWSATLIDGKAAGQSDHPRTVWTSPAALRDFQFGFDDLGGTVEDLVVRAARKDSDMRYFAYRWDGARFEPDGFASDTRLKNLPDSVWRYGAGQ